MFHCHVCGGATAKPESVSEIFTIDGRLVQVVGIPAEVCDRCGEATFARETTEQIRQLVHGAGQPAKTVAMDVFSFAAGGAIPALVRETPEKKYGK